MSKCLSHIILIGHFRISGGRNGHLRDGHMRALPDLLTSTHRFLLRRHWQKMTISRDGERLQRRDRHRLKAESEGFQTVPVLSLESFTILRYDIVLSVASEQEIRSGWVSVPNSLQIL